LSAQHYGSNDNDDNNDDGNDDNDDDDNHLKLACLVYKREEAKS
jgi:hypothetical protein